MPSASDRPARPALQPADRLIPPPQQPPAAVETSIGPPHYPAECAPSQTRSFNRACAPARGTQTLIRFKGHANSDSFFVRSTEPARRQGARKLSFVSFVQPSLRAGK